ncbi:Uncharacterized protein TCM_028378 [Theobroma cacao]|uniref:Uncharacterized protein n=1 Tax=Theobroma cacao TaxID=3641 RepID=A0A061GAH4_THECC|nr:Uncharacterized protein TCM_028378 [Theobroma cacao]
MRLTFFDRILHLIVAHTIRPIGTKYSSVKNEEMWFMYLIKEKTKFELANFIFDDMWKVVTGARKGMMYGMVISEILNFHRLDTSCDPLVPHPLHYKLNSYTIKKLDYENRNGVWVPNWFVQEENNEEEEKEQEVRKEGEAFDQQVECSVAPDTSHHHISNIEQTLTNLFGYVQSMDTRLMGQMITLDTRMRALNAHMDGLETRLTALKNGFHSSFAASPPPTSGHSSLPPPS